MELYNAVDELHLKVGGKLEEFENGATQPLSYLHRFAEELKLLSSGCGIFDLKACWLISLKGQDAGAFLQGMLTCDVMNLTLGEMHSGLICGNKGKIQHHVEILRKDQDQWLVICDPGEGREIGTKLDRFHVREDLELSLLNQQMLRMDLIGPAAKAQLMKLGFQEQVLEWSFADEKIYSTQFNLGKTSRIMNLVPLKVMIEFYNELLSNEKIGLIGMQAYDELRIWEGIPRMGIDYDTNNFPQEAALGDHITFNKGCYIGQEPHARMFHRGHPNWILTWLKIPVGETIMDQKALFQNGKEVGKITSAGQSEREGCLYAMGMIRYEVCKERLPLCLSEDQAPLVEQSLLPNTIGMN